MTSLDKLNSLGSKVLDVGNGKQDYMSLGSQDKNRKSTCPTCFTFQSLAGLSLKLMEIL